MQFFEWETQYQKAKKELKPIGHWTPVSVDLWYAGILREYMRKRSVLAAADPRPGNSMITLCAELDWYESGQPYYKVFPQMASVMSDISIDIPVSALELPYKTFVAQLANDDQNDFVQDGRRLRSVLVSEVHVKRGEDNKFKVPMNPVLLASGADRAFRVGYEFTSPCGETDLQFDYTMSLHGGESRTLEEEFQTSFALSIDEAMKSYGNDWVPGKPLIERIMRLAVATCFFGIDQHEVVMPDLQRKIVIRRQNQRLCSFEEAYHDVAREQRDVAKHWTIGREISLPRPLTESTNGSTEEGKGWTHASVRRGHMRWQPCGEGRKQRKLTFVHPHVCRPDLPWQRAPGFKIPDTNLEAKTS